jgi:hypothetical protein
MWWRYKSYQIIWIFGSGARGAVSGEFVSEVGNRARLRLDGKVGNAGKSYQII